jgi:hypothetical protein
MTNGMTSGMTRSMTSAAIYARVSSARQKKDETIASQTAALRAHAEQLGLDVPDEWVFEDEGHSGATLVRPALERLRDWSPESASTWCCATPRTGWPASSPTRPC